MVCTPGRTALQNTILIIILKKMLVASLYLLQGVKEFTPEKKLKLQ